MDEEKSMEARIASVHDIAHRLGAADFEVTDINLIIALTEGLSNCYDPFIVSLDTSPTDQLSVDSVISHLLNEESRQSCFHDTTALSHSNLGKKTWSKPSKAKSVASEEQPPYRDRHGLPYPVTVPYRIRLSRTVVNFIRGSS